MKLKSKAASRRVEKTSMIRSYFFVTVCTLVLAMGVHAAEPQVTEGFVNAPVGEVWRLFTTSEGFLRTGAAHAEVDLKLGGQIRAHYDPKGRLGDPETIVNEILAFEPERMLALRIKQPPASLHDKEATSGLWTVVYFTASGADMTHVRIVGLGYTEEPQSQAIRRHFEAGNRWTLDHIAKQFWPKCARCAAETETSTP
jgi:uncharacterized protein YndB with AHSA1/START domain